MSWGVTASILGKLCKHGLCLYGTMCLMGFPSGVGCPIAVGADVVCQLNEAVRGVVRGADTQTLPRLFYVCDQPFFLIKVVILDLSRNGVQRSGQGGGGIRFFFSTQITDSP